MTPRRLLSLSMFRCLVLAVLAAMLLVPAAFADGTCAGQPYQERPFADSDLIKSPTNFLRCVSGTYALCYYSGADPMPCTLDGDVANCQCQVFTATADDPMYVDINSILDKCAYEEAVKQCQKDGSGCINLCSDPVEYSDFADRTTREGLIHHGIVSACNGVDNPADQQPATVCTYIADGTFNRSAQFISTFSFSQVYPQGGADPFRIGSNTVKGAFAGCMTAPCNGTTTTNGNQYTTCACPVFGQNGPAPTFQFGRWCATVETVDWSPANCKLDEAGTQVWSAASSQLFFPPSGGSADKP